jgi:hypothetical protein
MRPAEPQSKLLLAPKDNTMSIAALAESHDRLLNLARDLVQIDYQAGSDSGELDRLYAALIPALKAAIEEAHMTRTRYTPTSNVVPHVRCPGGGKTPLRGSGRLGDGRRHSRATCSLCGRETTFDLRTGIIRNHNVPRHLSIWRRLRIRWARARLKGRKLDHETQSD